MDTKTLKDIIATRIQAENGNPTGDIILVFDCANG